MKYIDAEKLLKGIEKLKRAEYKPGGDFNEGRDDALEEVSSLIHSLQQEQPEVDLDKEVYKWKNKHGVVGMEDLWLKFARHFYELGINARK